MASEPASKSAARQRREAASGGRRASDSGASIAEDLAKRLLGRGKKSIPAAGIPPGAWGHLLAELSRLGVRPFVCVTPDEDAADELAACLETFLPPPVGETAAVLRLPAEPLTPYELPASRHAERMTVRLAALAHLASGAPWSALVISAAALAMRHVPAPRFAAGTVLTAGEYCDREKLPEKLIQLGFRRVPLVEDAGSFAVHGALLDVFPPASGNPARVEFFGDEVETIRLFDPETQRAVRAVSELRLSPAQEVVLTREAREKGEETLLELADRLSLPSAEVMSLVDDIRRGILPPGLNGIHPCFFPEGMSPLFDFLTSANPVFVLHDPKDIAEALEQSGRTLTQGYQEAIDRGELALPPQAHALSRGEILSALQNFRVIEHQNSLPADGASRARPLTFRFGSPLNPLLAADEQRPDSAQFPDDVRTHFAQALLAASRQQRTEMETWQRRIREWNRQGFHVAAVAGTQAQADKLKRLFEDHGLKAALIPGCVPSGRENGAPADDFDVHLHLGFLPEGFIDADAKLAAIAEQEITGNQNAAPVRRHRQARTDVRSERAFIQAFQSLHPGDLIVHSDYGIGRYEGLQRLTFGDKASDVMVIQYAGSDRIYMPVSRLRLVQKFTGASPENVALDRLGSVSWEKRKKAVREQLLRLASDLLRMEAARRARPGHAFQDDEESMTRFEAGFPFDETPDQQKAIDDVLADMRAPRPMDRLICGDVGFGKTEVALRAAFQAVSGGKQAAVLVPTTVLAAQHAATFRERFKNEPVRIDVLSRLHTAKENREVLENLAAGRTDIVIGTHRLLASDVRFADLGLLIIDEEHRFGVTHKEKLKKLKESLDVLTLTATPIPRTLNFALTGLRQMSLIATPPVERKAIRTFVIKDDPARVAEAIRMELRRGGQVFFVHNRVATIEQKRQELFRLVPEARYAVAHGQMEHGAIEKVMAEFAERKSDVLICSSIIESGLDIPTANTIIVERADLFGLSQLYQIRGRVGRSSERAYAYLLVPAALPLHRDARKRLEVLQSFTELGAGFHIAAQDLEIRGAGSLLGRDQSGQISAVGFDLYCRLLEEAVSEAKGTPPREDAEPDIDLPVPAYFPEEYLPDISLRLVFYKRMAEARGEEELEDLRSELRDRFGPLPVEVERLFSLMGIKVRLGQLRLKALECGPRGLVLTIGPEAGLSPERLVRFVQENPQKRRLTPQMKLVSALSEAHPRPEELFENCHRLLDAVERLRLPEQKSGKTR